MKLAQLDAASVDQIIQEYQEAASAHGRAILNGDHLAANGHYEAVAACARELKRRGVDAQRSLLPLLTSSDPEIRFCAAADALDFAPELGEQELRKLVESDAICGLNAYAILKQRGKTDVEFPKRNK
jgi:hypothetical protein